MAHRIAIAGIAIESSAYSPHRAGYRDFAVQEGADLVDRYEFLRDGGALRDRADWEGVLYARSIPGGRVDGEVYADFRRRIVDGLAALHREEPLDGLYLDIHGAMSVVGLDDAEGDLITAIRGAIGADVLISASMDLHGNVSRTLIEACDLITCYRMAPHEDAWETRERAARVLVDHLDSGDEIVKAWVRVPILLPGEKTSTRVEPAKSLYGRLPAVESRDGVTDAAIWIGYAWADEPRCHATVVVSGTDESVVAVEAAQLADEFWRVRDEFVFVGPPGSLEDGVAAALAATEKPYLISDSGDNPGAGGTGDVTWTLRALLAMPELTAADAPVTLCASVFDAGAIDQLARAELGGEVSVEAGARVDDRTSGPVRIEGTLVRFVAGDPQAGRIAVIRRGGLHVIVTEFRKAFHAVTDFTALDLDPVSADIVVTKIGYLEPELYAIARGWTLALTPGPVDQHLERLGHERLERPMFPFDEFPAAPDLTPEILR